MLSLLSTQGPRTLKQQQFTKNEWSILKHLIQDYPYYVPHEILLAELTSLSPTNCHQLLQETRLLGPNAIIHELKPVYRALSSGRAKLKKLYPRLKISLVRNMGYTLTLAPLEEDILN